MNSKSKIKIFKKIIEEVCKEYNGAKEIIVNKAKELRIQDVTPVEEVSKI